jgi:hypothetical protein
MSTAAPMRRLTFELRRPARQDAFGRQPTMGACDPGCRPKAACLVGSPLERGVRPHGAHCADRPDATWNVAHGVPRSGPKGRWGMACIVPPGARRRYTHGPYSAGAAASLGLRGAWRRARRAETRSRGAAAQATNTSPSVPVVPRVDLEPVPAVDVASFSRAALGPKRASDSVCCGATLFSCPERRPLRNLPERSAVALVLWPAECTVRVLVGPNVRAEAPGADGWLARGTDDDSWRFRGQGSRPWRVASRARG